MRSMMLLLSVMLLAACSQQSDPKDATGVAALQTQLNQIESQVTQLQKSASSGDWVLWASEQDLRNPLSGSGTSPMSAFPTKQDCLTSAAGWSLNGGKIVGVDPYIFQSKTTRATLRLKRYPK